MPLPTTARVAVSGVSYWFDLPYTYAVPPALAEGLRPGMRVLVPFGGGDGGREGVILSLGAEEGEFKSILSALDAEPVLSETMLRLALWMRERFFCTVSEAVRAILPAGLWYDIESDWSLSPAADGEEALDACTPAETKLLDALRALGGSASMRELLAALENSDPRRALSSLRKKGLLVRSESASRRVTDRTRLYAETLLSGQEAQERLDRLAARAPQQASVFRVLLQLGRASVANLCYFTGASRDAIRALEKKGLVRLFSHEELRRPDYGVESAECRPLPALNDEQQAAFDRIAAHLRAGQTGATLLYGVTGSGKTSVYLHLIDRTLRAGRSAVLLVPEIALTPQMLQTFSRHFGDGIAVLHSALSVGERYDEWKRIRRGEARLVIGTRSAVFAPVQNAALYILDEEQETTYKSDSAPRYHARDVAAFLSHAAGGHLVLGSATPDVTTMYAAESGRYDLAALRTRYNRQALPIVRVADMRAELKSGNGGSVSSLLRRELQANLDAGEQSILFLNRRGAHKLVTCGDCGYVFACPNCSVTLTCHTVGHRLLCHYCGHSAPVPSRCPECGGMLRYQGAGTQHVVEELGTLFPTVPVLRMDTDSVAPEGSHRKLFERFVNERIPILVGTQMVAKGLNFENVTLVGVLSADQSLYCGDYRAGERTFSLLTQVIGRSGRFSRPGRAVIQTFTPDNPVIRLAAEQNYDGFYRRELELRRLSGSPPFADLFVLTVTGRDEEAVLRCCADLRAVLADRLRDNPSVRVLGPAPLPVARVNQVWRYRVTLACPEGKDVRRLVSAAVIGCSRNSNYHGVRVYADFDPLE